VGEASPPPGSPYYRGGRRGIPSNGVVAKSFGRSPSSSPPRDSGSPASFSPPRYDAKPRAPSGSPRTGTRPQAAARLRIPVTASPPSTPPRSGWDTRKNRCQLLVQVPPTRATSGPATSDTKGRGGAYDEEATQCGLGLPAPGSADGDQVVRGALSWRPDDSGRYFLPEVALSGSRLGSQVQVGSPSARSPIRSSSASSVRTGSSSPRRPHVPDGCSLPRSSGASPTRLPIKELRCLRTFKAAGGSREGAKEFPKTWITAGASTMSPALDYGYTCGDCGRQCVYPDGALPLSRCVSCEQRET